MSDICLNDHPAALDWAVSRVRGAVPTDDLVRLNLLPALQVGRDQVLTEVRGG